MAPQLRRGRAKAGVDERLAQQGLARLRAREDQRAQRGLGARRRHHALGRHVAEKGRQPARAGEAVGRAAADQVVGHQQVDVGAQQHLREPVLQQFLQVGIRRLRRDVQAQVDKSAEFHLARRDEGAARPVGHEQPACARLRVGPGDGRQVDTQVGGDRALRGQAVARAQAAGRDRVLEALHDLQVARAAAGFERRQPAFRRDVRLHGSTAFMYGQCMALASAEAHTNHTCKPAAPRAPE